MDRDRLDSLETQVRDLEDKVDAMEEDLGAVRRDVAAVREDIASNSIRLESLPIIQEDVKRILNNEEAELDAREKRSKRRYALATQLVSSFGFWIVSGMSVFAVILGIYALIVDPPHVSFSFTDGFQLGPTQVELRPSSASEQAAETRRHDDMNDGLDTDEVDDTGGDL